MEFALVMPLLFLLLIGVADLARGFYLKIEIAGATRAGVRSGIGGGGHDLGGAVRSEPNSAIVNSTQVWGTTGPGATFGQCDQGSAFQSCGDPNGCVVGLADWTGGRTACFAVRSCSSQAAAGGGSIFSSCRAWGTRPGAGSGDALQVHVIYRFVPSTPAAGAFGQNGAFYLGADLVGIETY